MLLCAAQGDTEQLHPPSRGWCVMRNPEAIPLFFIQVPVSGIKDQKRVVRSHHVASGIQCSQNISPRRLFIIKFPYMPGLKSVIGYQHIH